MTETKQTRDEYDALFEATVELWLFIESLMEFLRVSQNHLSDAAASWSIMKRTIAAFIFAAEDGLMRPVFAVAPHLQAPELRPSNAPPHPKEGGRDYIHVREAMMERLAQEPAPGPYPSVAALVRACQHLRQLQTQLAEHGCSELATAIAPLAAQMAQRVAVEIGLFELGRLAARPSRRSGTARTVSLRQSGDHAPSDTGPDAEERCSPCR